MTTVPPRAARFIEMLAIIVTAVAILLGGPALLIALEHQRPAAAGALLLLAAMQLGALVRNRRSRGATAGLRSTRDLLFVIAASFAFVFVVAPARWALGSTIASIEFALVLELLAAVRPIVPSA